jgi:hypothetical protein
VFGFLAHTRSRRVPQFARVVIATLAVLAIGSIDGLGPPYWPSVSSLLPASRPAIPARDLHRCALDTGPRGWVPCSTRGAQFVTACTEPDARPGYACSDADARPQQLGAPVRPARSRD